jgi:hypothetical protein
MKLVLTCALAASLAIPAVASAQFRPQPSRLPQPSANAPGDIGSGDWDTRAQDPWDRQLRKCLNDRRQSKRERRVCGENGMPVKPRR